MKRLFLFLFLFLFYAFHANAQFTVSKNQHYLLKNGKPFFWLGDTGWELLHRLNKADADKYLRRRSEQGFTVIQAVVLSPLDGLYAPNANGDTPLIHFNPATPNEKYFEQVDYIIDQAAKYNLTIALLPTWGNNVYTDTEHKKPAIFTVDNAGIYSEWIANRYKEKNNIIWVLGGDRNPGNQNEMAIWRAMGNAIKKVTRQQALITFHPQPTLLGSAEFFHKDKWLDFNMLQTGHCRDAAVENQMQTLYHLTPVKPAIDGEPIYENIPVCFNNRDLGIANTLDVRRSAYLNLFAGAFGHTYGANEVWQMYKPGTTGLISANIYWYDALELPGANQMQFVRKLMESFPMLERIPDQSIIEENNLASAERIQATRGAEYLLIYSTAGKPFTVKPRKIKGKYLKGYWFNPRNGEKTPVTTFLNAVSKKFTSPTTGYGQDWVLALFNAARNFMSEP